MTIMTKEEVGAWCKEIADQINSDPILLGVFTRAYCTEEEEPMNEVKALRLAAGLTQRELSVATAIFPLDVIVNAELGEALTKTQWGVVQYVCNDRINIFKRDAGLTIKLG
jgi:hypothetical protein